MPEARIPRSLAACDALVIFDTAYVCDGYVRTTHVIGSGAGKRRIQRDSPTFSAMQIISVYKAASGEHLFSGQYNWIGSPAMQMEEIEGSAEDVYITRPDDRWMKEASAAFLYSLERRNWTLVP